jgi:glutathione S-transferase
MTDKYDQADLEIYWASGSPMAWPIQLALEEKELPHNSTMLDIGSGDTRSSEYIKKNPRGKVPVLRDGAQYIYESYAIIEYLELYYPTAALHPSSREEHTVDTIRRHETRYIYPAADGAISYTSYSSKLAQEDWDMTHLEKLAQPLFVEFERWNNYLSDRNWLAGGVTPTSSDLFFIPQLLYMHRFGFNYARAGFAHLEKYRCRVLNLQSVVTTWPPHWLETNGDPTFARVTNG